MKTLYYSTQIESKTGFCIFWPYSWKYPSKKVLSTQAGFESGRNQQNLFLSAIEGGVVKL